MANAVTGCGNRPIMEFDDRFGDRQTQAEAPEPGISSRGTLLEWVKERRKVFRRNADPAVVNFDTQGSVVLIEGADIDSSAFVGEFCGVLDQVPEDLLNPGRIGIGADEPGIGMDAGDNSLSREVIVHGIQRTGEHLVEIDRFGTEVDLLAGNLCDIEKIVDELGFECGILPNLHYLRARVGVESLVGLQGFGDQQDRR